MIVISLFVCIFTFVVIYSSQDSIDFEDDPSVSTIVGIRHGDMLCTGFVIDAEWVLTSARCVDSTSTIMIFAGDPEVYGTNSFVVESSFVVLHPEYNSLIHELAGHDIALVKVDLSFLLSKRISILPLTNETWPLNDYTYKRYCKFIGIGSNEGYQATPSLHISHCFAEHGYKACSGCMEGDQFYRLVCLKRADNVGICGSDTGGPLICDGKAVGIAHKIFKVGECRDIHFNNNTKCYRKGTVSAFMYICPYLEWINQYVHKTPTRCGNYLLLRSSSSFIVLDIPAWLLLSIVRILTYSFIL